MLRRIIARSLSLVVTAGTLIGISTGPSNASATPSCLNIGRITSDTSCTLEPGETIWMWLKGGNGGDGFTGSIASSTYTGSDGRNGSALRTSYTNNESSTQTIFVRIGSNGADGNGVTTYGGNGGTFTRVMKADDFQFTNLIALAAGGGGGGTWNSTINTGNGRDGGHAAPTIPGSQNFAYAGAGYTNMSVAKTGCAGSDMTEYGLGGTSSTVPNLGAPRGASCGQYDGVAGGGAGYRSGSSAGLAEVTVNPSGFPYSGSSGTLGAVFAGGGGSGFSGGGGGSGSGFGGDGSSYTLNSTDNSSTYALQQPSVFMSVAPTVTSFSPVGVSPNGGDTLTVTGSGFIQGLNVGILPNGGSASSACLNVSIINTTSFTCQVPANMAGSGYKLVLNYVDKSWSINSPTLSYVAPPTISKVEILNFDNSVTYPARAGTNTPTKILVTGTNFLHTGNGGSRDVIINVGGANCSSNYNLSIETQTSTELKCEFQGVASAGNLDVEVINPDGGSAVAVGAVEIIGPPVISSISPSSGDTLGGGTATITGSGFNYGIQAVQFGMNGQCTSVVVLSDTSLQCRIPAAPAASGGGGGAMPPTGGGGAMPPTGGGGAMPPTGGGGSSNSPPQPGAVKIQITNNYLGSTELLNAYTYLGPDATSISPVSGLQSGGTSVTVLGTSFTTNSTVQIGGVACNVTSQSSTSITCTTSAASSAGAADVVVTSNLLTDTLSGAFTFNAALQAPGTPGTPTVVSGDGQATVTVAAPSSGGTPDSYTVTASPGGGTCTVTGSTGSCTVTGLTNGTAYTFSSTATNSAGTSSSSTPSTSVTPQVVAPWAPGQPTVVVGDGQAVITVVAPSSGGTPASYTVTSSPGSKTCTVTGSSGNCTITGLTNGTAYTFAVTATNAGGTSTSSTSSSSVTPQLVAPGMPGKPTLVAGNGQVTITVSAPTSGGTPTSYLVTASPGTATCTVTGASGSCVISGLTNGTTYTFGSSATNGGGTSSNSSTASATPTGPAPTITSISPNSAGSGTTGIVTITGNNFASGTVFGRSLTVTIAGASCLVQQITSTQITCNRGQALSPTPGYRDVVITNPDGGSLTSSNIFLLVSGASINSVSPSSGSTSGGTSITLTGVNLYSVTEVLVGGNPCTVTSPTWSGTAATTLVCITSPGTAGLVDIKAANIHQIPYGSTLQNSFTYVSPPTPPGTPGQATAVAGDGQATVTVSPSSSGGNPTSYLVTASPGGATCTVTGASGSCVVTGLTNGTSYTFTSTASNGGGTSNSSLASASTTPQPPAPGAPGQATAVAGDGQATVTVSPPSSGGNPTLYLVTASPGGATCTVTGSSGSCVVTGLTNGTSYTFTSTASNGGGTSTSSTASSAVTPTLSAPASPGTPTVVIGDGQATVTVVAPSSGGTPASYTVTASPGGATCTVSTPATSCIVTGLTNGTSYTFSVVATNAAGSSSSSTASLPATPTQVSGGTGGTGTGGTGTGGTGTGGTGTGTGGTGTGTGGTGSGGSNTNTSSNSDGTIVAATPATPTVIVAEGSATISWSAPTAVPVSSITGYQIQHSVNSGTTWKTVAKDVDPASTSYVVTGLTTPGIHLFRIAAMTSKGMSPFTIVSIDVSAEDLSSQEATESSGEVDVNSETTDTASEGDGAKSQNGSSDLFGYAAWFALLALVIFFFVARRRRRENVG